MTRQLLFVFALVLTSSLSALAQTDTSASGMDEVESLFSKDEDSAESASSKIQRPTEATSRGDSSVDGKQSEIKDISGLGRLQDFKDIAVIQKRYLPKTNRGEIYLGPTMNLNDSFFVNFGGSIRLGYYFRERYGVEAVANILTVSERQVTTDLASRGVRTTSFITPRSFYGADFKWAPMYGKMTWANRKITPFDLYLSFGAGLTGTNQGDSNATFHLGTGQIFALSKATAFRWDFSWYMFSAKSSVDPSGSSSLYHNLLFTMGWSWFFPEATYR